MSTTTSVADLASGPRLKRNVGEALWVGFGYALAAAGQVVGVRLLTNLLGPAEYGEVALVVTVGLLVQQVIYAPAASGALRFFAPSCEQRTITAFFGAVRTLSRRTNLALLVLASVTLSLLAVTGQRKWAVLLLPSLVYAMVFGHTTILNGIQNAGRNRAVVAWHGGIAAWLRALFSVLFVVYIGRSSQSAVWGYAVASAVVLASQHWFYVRLQRRLQVVGEADAALVARSSREMWTYGYPFIAWGTFSWLQSSSDRWVLEVFSSTAAVGRYQALYQVSVQPLLQLASFATQLATPIIFARAGDGSDSVRLKNVKKATDLIVGGVLVVGICAAIVVSIFKSEIFSLVLGSRFRSDLWLAPILVASGAVYAATQIASITLMAKNATSRLVLPRVTTAMGAVLLSVIGAKYYGLPGVVAANLLTACTMLVWLLILGGTPGSKQASPPDLH